MKRKYKEIEVFKASTDRKELIPVIDGGISAGFPSPAQDFLDKAIDLNEEVVRNPASTYFARVKGRSLEGIMLFDGDILVIDKSLTPVINDLVVCIVDGDFAVKFLIQKGEDMYLKSANREFSPIKIESIGQEVRIWGKVTWTFWNNKNLIQRFKDWELVSE